MNRSLHNLIRLVVALSLVILTGCATTSTMTGSSDEHFSRALVAMESLEYARAEEILTGINEREPDHAGVWANLGIVLTQLERESEAVQALQQAITLNPDLAAAHNELGVLHRRAGRLIEAERAYNAALDANPDHAAAHHNIGVLYDLYLGSPGKALEHYQRFIQLSPDDKQVGRWVVELERRIQVREARYQ